MAWINSQLKKKPGARLVEDLRNDTRDGVAFIELISVIGREDYISAFYAESVDLKKKYIDKVAKFQNKLKAK